VTGHTINDFHNLPRLSLKDKPLSGHKEWYSTWKRRLDEGRKKENATEKKEETTNEELVLLAKSVIDAPDALELYREEFRKIGYGGDLTPVTVVMLAATTRLLKMRRGAMPSHVGVIGPASIGKSYTVQMALSLLPPEAFHTIDAGSQRALIYDAAELKHRVLCFSESDSLPSGEDNTAASAIRNLVQDHFLHYSVVVKDPETGQFVTKEINKEGPTILMTTAIRFIGGQLGTRLFLIEVPEDMKRIQAALATQGELEIAPPPEPSQPLIAYQTLLQRSAPIDVIVPFAPALAEEIGKSANAARILRDYQKLLALIKAVAILRIPHPKRSEDSRLIATVDDYGSVFKLVREMYETSITEISRRVREVVETVSEMEKKDKLIEITYSAVAKHLNVRPEQVKRRARRAIKQGWLVNKEERKSYPAKLTAEGADPLPESAGLPDPSSFVSPSGNGCESVKWQGSPAAPDGENAENSTSSDLFTADFTISHLPSQGCETVKDPVKPSEVAENVEDFEQENPGGEDHFTLSHPIPEGENGVKPQRNGFDLDPDDPAAVAAYWAKLRSERKKGSDG